MATEWAVTVFPYDALPKESEYRPLMREAVARAEELFEEMEYPGRITVTKVGFGERPKKTFIKLDVDFPEYASGERTEAEDFVDDDWPTAEDYEYDKSEEETLMPTNAELRRNGRVWADSEYERRLTSEFESPMEASASVANIALSGQLAESRFTSEFFAGAAERMDEVREDLGCEVSR